VIIVELCRRAVSAVHDGFSLSLCAPVDWLATSVIALHSLTDDGSGLDVWAMIIACGSLLFASAIAFAGCRARLDLLTYLMLLENATGNVLLLIALTSKAVTRFFPHDSAVRLYHTTKIGQLT